MAEHRDDAPRVYLDSAVLMDIADRGADWDDASRLRDTMRAKGAVLVVSIGHLWDAFRSKDAATKQRVASAVDAFSFKAIVPKLPFDSERAELDRVYRGDVQIETATLADIRLAFFDCISSVLTPELEDQLELLGDASQQMTDADAIARQAGSFNAQPKEDQKLAISILEQLMEAGSVADVMLKLAGAAGPTPELQTVIDRFRTLEQRPGFMERVQGQVADRAASAAARAKAIATNQGGVAIGLPWVGRPGGLGAWEKIAPRVTPGDFVVYAAAKANANDPNRSPDEGDHADRTHLGLIPYVDLATVDAHNFGATKSARAQIRSLRTARVERNPPRGTLQPVVDAVAAL